MFWHLAGNVIN